MVSVVNYAGFWTGKLTGTNEGGFSLDLTQHGSDVHGTAKISEPALGTYEYRVIGKATDFLSLTMTPSRNDHGIQLGLVTVVVAFEGSDSLSGRWESTIGTSGVVRAERFTSGITKEVLPAKNSVFIVHGQDEIAKVTAARFLSNLGLEPVILHEQLNRGMTIIEKFEEYANRAGYAVILMTPDDLGYPVGKEDQRKLRARQNVILELGYFAAKLGREKTFVLVRGEIEIPSDVIGVVYERMENEGWKINLARELKAAGFDIDLNKIINM